MGEFLAELTKLLNTPTRRKVLTVLGILLLCAAVILIYERYTATFRLSRLQKEHELLIRLEEVQKGQTNYNNELRLAREALTTHTVELLQEKPLSLAFVSANLTLSWDTAVKFIFSSLGWWAIVLYNFTLNKSIVSKGDIYGNITIAIVAGVAGAMFPAFLWPWFHLLIFPFLFAISILSLVLSIGLLITSFRSAKQKAQRIACTNNLKLVGLATRSWAHDHSGNLPADFETMKDDLVSLKITKCPTNPDKPYEILSPDKLNAAPTDLFAYCPVHNIVVLADGSVHTTGLDWLKDNYTTAKANAYENKCINNLRQIDSAIQQWAVELGKTEKDIPTINDISPYLKEGEFPQCPSGGNYKLHAVGQKPACSVSGHSLNKTT